MLNCTSMAGCSVHWKLSGAFGFSTERSLMYCDSSPATGSVSSPLPTGALSVSRLVRTSPSSAMLCVSFELDRLVGTRASTGMAAPQRSDRIKGADGLDRSCSFVFGTYFRHDCICAGVWAGFRPHRQTLGHVELIIEIVILA